MKPYFQNQNNLHSRLFRQILGFRMQSLPIFLNHFFSGIFLETELETSSRMFEFVYKMFGEGHATIPKAGIEGDSKAIIK